MALWHACRPSIHAAFGALLAAMSVHAGDTANPNLGLPPIVIPADNPLTPEKIALGKKLFMDRRLSKNATLSCAMCHVPEQGFTQNELATSVGFEGKSLRRNAPSLLNVAIHNSFQRDGAKQSLEAQVWGPLLAHNEMANGSVKNVVERINSLPDYDGVFEQAFAGKGPNEITIGQAIANFERTLLSGDSRFDRWYFGGEVDALSQSEQAGFRVFISAQCNNCHWIEERVAPFTDNRFHNTGVYAASELKVSRRISVQLAPGVTIEIEPNALSSVSEPALRDDGRFEVSSDPRDRHAFKTPSLRNVALTAPYMHDGSMASLEDVVEFYSSAAANAKLSPGTVKLTKTEATNLIEFLRTLTGNNVSETARSARLTHDIER
jgi:cytochrome c peroxidase